jgi:hypothetical protein
VGAVVLLSFFSICSEVVATTSFQFDMFIFYGGTIIIQDPYPVIIARNWARDMAVIECILCFGCLVTMVTLTSKGNDQVDDIIADDDHIKVAGFDITGQITVADK